MFARKDTKIARRALDQSSRYADLSLDEDTLIRNGSLGWIVVQALHVNLCFTGCLLVPFLMPSLI